LVFLLFQQHQAAVVDDEHSGKAEDQPAGKTNERFPYKKNDMGSLCSFITP
jgi:hypothetical protein